MIRKLLAILNYKELTSNKYYYEFQYNLNKYFIFKENDLLKIFSLTRFAIIEPIELITEFWIESPASELESVKTKVDLFSKLENHTHKEVLGVYFRLISLTKAKSINDDIDDYIIDQLSTIEVIGKTFLISKNGLSIMTKSKQETSIPEGIILFSKFNVDHHGYPNIYIPKAGGDMDQTPNGKLTHLLFNPITLVDIYNKTYNHYNSSFFISSNIKETTLQEINKNSENIIVHIRPTLFELTSYLYFIEKIYNNNGIEISFQETINNTLLVRLYVPNYAVIRNGYVNRLNEKHGKSNRNYRVRLIKKNARIDDNNEKFDYIEFEFVRFPNYILSFIKIFMLEFYEESLNLKDFTHLYYEDEFTLSIEENVPTAEELYEASLDTINDQVFDDFDDSFADF